MTNENQATRLANMINLGKAKLGVSVDDLASKSGIPAGVLSQVSSGLLPLSADQVLSLATVLNMDPDDMLEAAKEFVEHMWAPSTGDGVSLDEIVGQSKTIRSKPPEVLFCEYREGWFSGASGRDDPGDMGPEWRSGHEDGRAAMETALHQRRSDLDIGYGKAGSET